MPYRQTFPNGQTLNSSALSADDFTSLLQQATCYIFGYMNKQPFSVVLDENSNVVIVEDVTSIQLYMKIESNNVPAKTIITAIDVANNTVTLNNKPLISGPSTLLISNPLAGRLVRQEWPDKGQPGWDKSDEMTFLRAVEEDDWYNKVRDEGAEALDDESATSVVEYTRVWRVSWNLYGPDAYQRATLLKSALLLDTIHDSLQALNVYVVPNIANPVRFRELYQGQWWERTDLDVRFYEQVNENIVASRVASVEVLVMDDDGIKLDLNIGA